MSVLDRIGVCGVLLVLWTAAICCALVGSDASTLRNIWSELIIVWISIAGLTVLSMFFVSHGAGVIQ